MARSTISGPAQLGPTSMVTYEVRVWLDVLTARRAVKHLASEIGFAPRESTELAIVASELGSNILKYGRHGTLGARALEVRDPRDEGIAIVARDYGPPFHDLQTALQDGCDDRGPLDPLQLLSRKGIGGGLGAVLRLTHAFRVLPLAEGKEILAERYLRRALKP
ncbi:MAG TPA: ATP-binding protein, partial [Polyangiaceae bacterium]|nr:ATP-binding protein [Polyangiaceae bacterium]